MKKLVLGTTKTVVVPAILKEKQPSIDALNVTPSTSAQTITAPSGTDGYSPVNVSAVTSSIDANIQAGNIKDGVTILGVTGNYQGGGSAPAYYIEKTVDANGKLISSNTQIINLSNVTDIGDFALAYAYYGVNFQQNTSIDLSSLTTVTGSTACLNMFRGCRGVVSVDLSSLTSIVGMQAFDGTFASCTNLTSVDLSSLTTISGQNSCQNMFSGCVGLTSVDLSSLTTISGTNSCYGIFYNCTALTSINLSSLATISVNNVFGNAFSYCYALTNISFNSLTTISGPLAPSYASMFTNCKVLEQVNFGGLKSTTFATITNQLQYLFDTNTGSQAPNGCTVHFPSNFDPSDPDHTFDASTLTGYPTFGGNANYIHVAFDLPATE